MPVPSLTTTVRVSGTQTGVNDLTTPSEAISYAATRSWTNGTGAGQVNKVWLDTRTLSASATENLDLAGGLTDSFGSTLTFASVKSITVKAADGNANNVVVGGAAANAFVGVFADSTDKIAVRPGGKFHWEAPGAGATVTAGTGDILLVANSGAGTSVTYDIIIAGTV